MARPASTSRTRARINTYVTAAITAIAAGVFLNAVPFIPAAPFLPLVVAVVLGVVSLRESGVASAGLYLLAFFSTLWQLIGFGFFHLLSTGVGLAVLALVALPVAAFLARRVDAAALPLAILAVGLMMTPQYYLALPLVVVAAMVFNLATAAALSFSFVLLLTPFLLLENGLYLSGASAQGVLPVVFAPLSSLDGVLRPPLPNLNVLVSQFPPGYLSPMANAVAAFVSNRSSVMAIPLVILFAVLLGSASLVRFARPYAERFRLLENERLWSLIVRLGAAVVAPAISVALLAVLSLPGAGGFQTSVVQSAAVPAAVVGVAAVIGASFVGLDTITARLEGGEVSSTKLEVIISEFKSELTRAEQLLDKISALVPSMNLSAERKTLSESESYARDIEMQLATATEDAAAAWIERFTKVVRPAILEMEERLRKSVIGEVAFLSSVSLTANSNLHEADVELMYPAIEGVGRESTLEEAILAYEKAVSSISETTSTLFDLFVSTTDSFYKLMGQERVLPAVSPLSLLRSHDYAAVMRLVSGEYWLDFHVKKSEEFAERVEAVKGALGELQAGLGEGDREKLSNAVESKFKASPSQSTLVLQGTVELKFLIGGALEAAVAEADAIRRLISSIDPTALSIIRLEATEQSADLRALMRNLGSVGDTLDDFLGFLNAATPLLKARVDSISRDKVTLIVLSQYPVAAKVIDSLFERRKRAKIDLLPFQRKASALYCKLYAAANPSLKYDEISEVLSVRDA